MVARRVEMVVQIIQMVRVGCMEVMVACMVFLHVE